MKKIISFVSINFVTLGGIGFFPKAPGTIASLVALISFEWIKIFLLNYSRFFLLSFMMLIIIFGTLLSHYSEKRFFKSKDPSSIVIDEYVGMMLSTWLLPFEKTFKSYGLLVLAFCLFRFLDIKKPFFISTVQKIKGGLGIMIDDLIAGAITCSVVTPLYFLF